jgi:uncharacterized protein with PIN domain
MDEEFLVTVPKNIPLAYCPICHRHYWEGSHTRNMREQLREIMNGIKYAANEKG